MSLSNYSSYPGQDVSKSWPRHILPAIGQQAICIESRSPDPFKKSHLGISHIWACPLITVFLANTYYRNWPRHIPKSLPTHYLYSARTGLHSLAKIGWPAKKANA